MKLFYTNAAAKLEIANLETEIATLTANAEADAKQIATLTEDLATANESIAELTTERDEAAAAVEVAESTATQAAADLAAANEKLSTFDAEVESAAQAKFASLGGAPIESSSTSDDDKSLAGLTGLAKATAIHKKQSIKK